MPDSLLDDSEGFEGLPYVALFYAYLPGGFSLTGRKTGVHQDKPKKPPKPPKPYNEELHGQIETMRRLAEELHEKREGEKRRLAIIHDRYKSTLAIFL